MRVLMFGWEFPPHISGGLGSACEGMVRALTGKGTQVIFVLPRLAAGTSANEPEGLKLESANGTRITHMGGYAQYLHKETKSFWSKNLQMETIDSPLFPYCTPEFYRIMREDRQKHDKEYVSSFRTPLPAQDEVIHVRSGYGAGLMDEVYRYSLAGQAIAMRNDFDVIHAHDWITYPAGILAKKATGKPLVVHVHATEVDRSGEHSMNPVVSHIEWQGMQAADRVVTVSQLTKDIVMRVYGVPESKIEVVYNAVSRREAGRIFHTVKKPDDPKQVLFMGRVTFQKGPDYFVEAARLVLNAMPNVRFVMAGSGDMLRAMVARVAKYRMGRRFTFTGFLKGSEVDRMYAASDLYVMPSVSEPFGIAPLEAMVYDVPVLMSKQSGVAEVVQNALKVDFWDVRAMADRICAVLSYPTLGQFMVRNCQQELKHIRWEKAADKLNSIYEALIAREN